ncbi:MAG: GAF domain-containing protein [Burkholderiales bacterium]
MQYPQKHNEEKEPFLKRHETIFNAVPITIVLVDTNMHPLFINKRGVELFGLNEIGIEDIHAVALKILMQDGTPFAPEDMPVSRSLHNGEIVRHNEVLIENMHGAQIPVFFLSTPIRDSAGEITSAFIVMENMTERKQTIEIFNFQKRLLSNVTDAIAAYDKDKKIIYWNETAQKIYGWSGQEILGRPADEMFCIGKAESLRHNAVKDALLERSCSGEISICHKNGRLIHTEVHTKVFTGEDGAFNGAVAVFRDITQRKRHEKILGRQKNLLQMVNAIYEKAFYCDTMEELALAVLRIIESATKSDISIVGEVGYDGLFHIVAVSQRGTESRSRRDKHLHDTACENGIRGLFEAVIRSGQTLAINDIKTSGKERLPDHPEITSFLGAPFMQNGKVTGIVAVANREGGYRQEEEEMLEALTPSVMEVLLRKRAEEALKKSDERLKFLLKLSDSIRPLTDPAAIEYTASGLIAKHLSAKAAFIKCREPEKLGETSFFGGQINEPSCEHYIYDIYPTALKLLGSGEPLIVQDYNNNRLLPAGECKRALEHGIVSSVSFPLFEKGSLIACLCVFDSTPRDWTPLEVSLVKETAERTWAAVQRAFTEERLRKREEQLRALVTASSEELFRMSPDCSAITQLHGQGSIEKLNNTWLEKYIPPEDRQQIVKIIEDAKRNKSIVELEHRINASNGEIGWAYTRAVPLLDKAGNIIEWIGSTTDVTGRKKAYEQLQKNKMRNELLASITSRLLLSENPCQIIYDLCTMAMKHIDCDVFFNYIVDKERGCLHLNAVTGIPEEDVGKFEWLDFGAAVCGCVAQEGERIVAECITEKPDVRTVDIAKLGITAYACHPLKADNSVIGTLAFGSRLKKTFTDYDLAFMSTVADYIAIALGRLFTNDRLKKSERQAYELVEQLKEEDKNKNEFLSILSHELRNPLATITAGISFLDAVKNKKQERQAKEIIKRQSEQLCKLVDDLLDITRITQNKIRLKKSRIDLNKLAALAAEDMRMQFERKGIRLETDIPSGRFYLEADPVRISQTIGNLLNNALKFTESGGHVIIKVYKDKKHAVISVKDSGIGINEEMLDRIFQPFVQADESLERSGGGLGMGLGIAKGICELHGGTISAKSDGLGKGSTFEIRLPAAAQGKQTEGAVPNNNSSRRLRVLLIEDNRDFAELLGSMFRQIGHEADIAKNGPEGIGKAKAIRPDIIFCDIGLPDMNGYEVARLLKEDAETKGIYLVALTGYAGQQDIEHAASSGFDKHIAKPVSIETIQKVLNQLS